MLRAERFASVSGGKIFVIDAVSGFGEVGKHRLAEQGVERRRISGREGTEDGKGELLVLRTL